MSQDPSNSPDGHCAEDPPSILAGHDLLINRLFAEAHEYSWGLTRDRFAQALERSAQKRFGAATVLPVQIEEYLGALHLQDLILATACALGSPDAWEHFVAAYRRYLRSAAGAILHCSPGSPAASEMADSLFADLYGLNEKAGVARSLFRYFHGRSSLKTWLRAILAQRHIDQLRQQRRFTDLDKQQSAVALTPNSSGGARSQPAPPDPHRDRYVSLFTRTLEVALGLLNPRNKERLRLYYAEEQTLAEIGGKLGEHGSSVSRNLERTRRELRHDVEEALRKGSVVDGGPASEAGLSDAEISLCFEYAAQQSPLDFDKLFPPRAARKTTVERQEP
jgi:RNA polymerase sigma factor (sigma-70 family)